MNGYRQYAAHFLIAQTAKDMAGAMFEELMHNDEQYSQWKAMCPELTPDKLQAMFIAKMWPFLVKKARATLAGMLNTNIPEELKTQISDALILDASLKRGPLH